LIDEIKRKKLLKIWALNWWDLTNQPIDEVYSYFGTKVSVTIMLVSFVSYFNNDFANM